MDHPDIGLALLRIVVCDQQGFNRQPTILTGAHFTQLLEQFGQWAHFRNHARYVTARGAEKEPLLEAARNGASFASETIEALRPWSGLFDGFSPERTELRPRRRRSTMMKVRLSRARQNVLKALP